jgi:glycosyltransferase involved in cell wall biosynthesis
VRILYGLGTYPIPPHGGVEQAIYEVARGAGLRGAEVRVIAPSAVPRHDRVDAVDFESVPAGAISTWIKVPSLRALRTMRDDLEWADVLHIWNPQELFNLALIQRAIRRRLPFVLSTPIVAALGTHPRPLVRWAGRVDDALVHQALRRAALVHVQNHADELLASRWSSHVRYIPGGIPEAMRSTPNLAAEFRRRHSLEGHDPLLLFLGRCHPLKGPDEFVRAVALVRKTVPSAVGVVVGPEFEDSRSRLRKISSELGVSEAVHLLGAVSDEDRIGAIDAASVVAIPSRADFVEGFCLVASEAWARHRPVAAYPVGALRERVKDGENGYLARTTHPPDMADAILACLRMGPVTVPADVIGWPAVTDRFFEEYERVVDGPADAPVGTRDGGAVLVGQ